MAVTLIDLKAHCNVTDSNDDAVLTTYLAAAQAHVERLLGFSLYDPVEFPGLTPPDLNLAVMQLAADWYENREASISGTIIGPIPFGVREIVNEYRTYTFGLADAGSTDGG